MANETQSSSERLDRDLVERNMDVVERSCQGGARGQMTRRTSVVFVVMVQRVAVTSHEQACDPRAQSQVTILNLISYILQLKLDSAQPGQPVLEFNVTWGRQS